MQSVVGDRREWILALLHAPVEGSRKDQIQGRTRLMKGSFLLSKELDDELGTETDFQFRSDKHGPLDPLVFQATEELEREGKMKIIDVPNKQGGDYYRLTDEGIEEAEAVWDNLTEEEQEVLTFIRNRHVEQPLSQILSYVYRRFPNYADTER